MGTTRVFVDDLELAIRALGNADWMLTEATMHDSICSLYLVNGIYLEGESANAIKWEDREIEGRGPTRTLVLRYSANLSDKKKVFYHSNILTEIYRDQVNMVHLKNGAKRQSRNLDYLDTSWELSREE